MPKHDIALHPQQAERSDRPDYAMDAPISPPDVLAALRSAAPDSLDQIVTLTYQELRSIAHRRLAARRPGGTLSTTALVHEAYLKLVDQSRAGWRDRSHFLALASLAMRHILVDRARERAALRRGGGRRQITLDDDVTAIEDQSDALLQLNDALEHLAAVDARLARVVECRFFGGLTEDETAEALGLTTRTVQRDWVKARVLLRRLLES
jgi:RNA polymerase sigma factor (TIGR02999 family)